MVMVPWIEMVPQVIEGNNALGYGNGTYMLIVNGANLEKTKINNNKNGNCYNVSCVGQLIVDGLFFS